MSLLGVIKARAKKVTQPGFWRRVLEIQRIRSLPRYQAGTTWLLGRPVTFTDGPSFLQAYQEIFEQEVYVFTSKSDRPVIFDCGSNIGLSIIYFKRLYPKAKLFAFEPDRVLFDIARKNLDAFGINDIEFRCCAVMDVGGTVTFFSEGASSGRVVDADGSNNGAIHKVDSVALKTLMNSRIDFLKIDIEGAELTVLASVEAQLHWVENLFIEYHSFVDQQQELDQLLAILKRSHFRYLIYPAIEKQLPFREVTQEGEMDMQLNIYAFRK